MTPAAGLLAGNQAHGVVERQAEDLDVEVDGIAGEVAFGPAPVSEGVIILRLAVGAILPF